MCINPHHYIPLLQKPKPKTSSQSKKSPAKQRQTKKILLNQNTKQEQAVMNVCEDSDSDFLSDSSDSVDWEEEWRSKSKKPDHNLPVKLNEEEMLEEITYLSLKKTDGIIERCEAKPRMLEKLKIFDDLRCLFRGNFDLGFVNKHSQQGPRTKTRKYIANQREKYSGTSVISSDVALKESNSSGPNATSSEKRKIFHDNDDHEMEDDSKRDAPQRDDLIKSQGIKEEVMDEDSDDVTDRTDTVMDRNADATDSTDDVMDRADDVTDGTDDVTQRANDVTNRDDVVNKADDITRRADDVTDRDGVMKKADDINCRADVVTRRVDDITDRYDNSIYKADKDNEVVDDVIDRPKRDELVIQDLLENIKDSFETDLDMDLDNFDPDEQHFVTQGFQEFSIANTFSMSGFCEDKPDEMKSEKSTSGESFKNSPSSAGTSDALLGVVSDPGEEESLPCIVSSWTVGQEGDEEDEEDILYMT